VTGPDRHVRRQCCLRNTSDAGSASPAVCAERASVRLRTRDGLLESLRVQRFCRSTAQRARRIALQIMRAAIGCAPDKSARPVEQHDPRAVDPQDCSLATGPDGVLADRLVTQGFFPIAGTRSPRTPCENRGPGCPVRGDPEGYGTCVATKRGRHRRATPSDDPRSPRRSSRLRRALLSGPWGPVLASSSKTTIHRPTCACECSAPGWALQSSQRGPFVSARPPKPIDEKERRPTVRREKRSAVTKRFTAGGADGITSQAEAGDQPPA